MRTNIEIETTDGILVLQMEGRKLMGVSNRVALQHLIQACPILKQSASVKTVDKQEVMKFFGKIPMDFTGYDDLKEAYTREREAAASAKCPPCQIGALIRKYIKLVTEAMQADLETERTDNGVRGV